MNWDQLAGKWLEAKGSIRQKWGKLTDDDLEVIAGSKDKFLGRVQARYGIAKEEAERQLDQWAMDAAPDDQPSSARAARERAAKR